MWASSALLAGQISGLVATVATARLLGPADFGLLAFAITTSTAMAGVAAFAPVLGITRDIAAGAQEAETVRANGRHAAATVAVLAVLLLGVIAAGWLPLLVGPVRALVVVALGAGLTALQLALAVIVGRRSFAQLARIRVVSGMTSAALQVGGAWIGGASGAILGAVIGAGVAAALAWVALPPWQPQQQQGASAAPTRLARADWWATLLTGTLAMPVLWVAQGILTRQSDGATQVAIVAALAPIGLALQFAPTSLGQVLLPAFASQQGSHHQFRRALLFTVTITLIPWGLLSATARWWFPLFGPAYQAGLVVVPPLLLALALQGASIPLVKRLEASGRMRTNLALNIGWAIVLLMGTWTWRERGAIAYAWAAMGAFLVHGGGLLWTNRDGLRT